MIRYGAGAIRVADGVRQSRKLDCY